LAFVLCGVNVVKPRDLHKSFDNLDCYLRYLSANSSHVFHQR